MKYLMAFQFALKMQKKKIPDLLKYIKCIKFDNIILIIFKCINFWINVNSKIIKYLINMLTLVKVKKKLYLQNCWEMNTLMKRAF